MKFAHAFCIAACIPVAVTDARFRGWKKNKVTEANGKQMEEKTPMFVGMDSLEEEEATNPNFKRFVASATLNIVGIGPNETLSDEEIVYLENLILKNLNEENAMNGDPFVHHSLLFAGPAPHSENRELSIWNEQNIDESVFDEYTCKYCPDDREGWYDPRKGPWPTKPPKTPRPTAHPTRPPTESPSVAPSYDFKPLSEIRNNLCKGTVVSPLLRMRKITRCSFK